MKRSLTRRQALKKIVTAAAGIGAGAAGLLPVMARDYEEPVEEAKGLTVYPKHHRILLRNENLPLTVYRAHPTQKYPYFFPVSGPVSGLPLTCESCLPYPHHRGLWLGCDPLNGGNYWHGSLDTGQIKSVERAVEGKSETSVTFTDRCRWIRKGGPSPLRDERRFTVKLLDERRWLMDARFKLTAQQDVTIGDAKHSLFAIRTAADISPAYGGVLYNAKGGTGAEGTYGKEARWCGFYGERKQDPGTVEGITIMTHPDNPWRPVWFTREYGHLSPSPFHFREDPWTLPSGESVTLKYRVVLHAGKPEKSNMDGLYEDWAGS